MSAQQLDAIFFSNFVYPKMDYMVFQTGDKNPNWKGDGVTYRALHCWVRDHLPKPELCEICHSARPYDLANKSGKYLRDLSDWQYVCRRCHHLSDGRMTKYAYKKGGESPFKGRRHSDESRSRITASLLRYHQDKSSNLSIPKR
jgi:hypothetical protein